MTRRFLLTALVAALVAAPAAFAENWPQWRGPKNDGHSSEKGLPTEWGPDKNVVWKLKMPGRGSSTPCIWEDKIFVTAQTKTEVLLLCVGTDGKEKWQKPIGTTAGFPYNQADADNATASCTTDGKHVWAFAGSGKLSCFDLDGKPVWDADLQKYGKFRIQFGPHWTPVLYKGKLYCQVMHGGRSPNLLQMLVALDAATGKELWAVDRPGYGKGESPDVYASPFIWEGTGGPLLVAHGNDYCTAHKLDDGAEVWRVNGLNPTTNPAWRFVSCPLVTPDLIVVPSCKNGPTVAFNPVGAKGAIEPGTPAEKWRLNFTPDVVSPLLVGDVVYLLKDGPFYAIDAKTGAQVYQQSLAKQIYRGNMVAADGKIYLVGRSGVGHVIQAGREFKLLATNDLKEQVLASPAISNGRLYIRGYDHLYSFGTK